MPLFPLLPRKRRFLATRHRHRQLFNEPSPMKIIFTGCPAGRIPTLPLSAMLTSGLRKVVILTNGNTFSCNNVYTSK